MRPWPELSRCQSVSLRTHLLSLSPTRSFLSHLCSLAELSCQSDPSSPYPGWGSMTLAPVRVLFRESHGLRVLSQERLLLVRESGSQEGLGLDH